MAPSASGPVRFGLLLSATWSEWKQRLMIFLCFALCTAVVAALVQAIAVLLPTTLDSKNIDFAHAPLGLILLYALIQIASICVAIVVTVSYWVVAVLGETDWQKAVRRSLPLVFPFIGLSLWVLLRSWAWLFFVGILVVGFGGASHQPLLELVGLLLAAVGFVLAIVFGPRFFVAPYLFFKQGGKGIRDSVESSYRRTQGYWGKIIGNGLLLSLILFCVFFVIGIAVSVMEGILIFMMPTFLAIFLGGVAMLTCQGLSTGLNVLFAKNLSATILDNPRSAD